MTWLLPPSFTARRLWLVLALAPLLASPAQAVRAAVGLGTPLSPAPLSAPACDAPADPLDLALWQVVQHAPDLTCDNAFVEYQRTPRSAEVPENAFDKIAAQIREAKTEVLLANMEWHAGPGYPGYTFAEAVRDLYARVSANPAAYPQGMTVRVALGGFPDLQRGDGGTLALRLVRDLRGLGVPLVNEAVGWRVAVMNYPYVPHSHVKLHVIDGQDVTVAGFNFTEWHQTAQEPGGRDLHDLGLRMHGPVAQAGVAVFDDLWRHSQQVRCPAGVAAADVFKKCAMNPPDPVAHPQAARNAVVAGSSRAFLLYRRPGYDMADRAQLALIGAATQEIDLMEADFSPSLGCWLAYLDPQNCGQDTFTPYLAALLGAMERGVKVRVLTVDYGYGKVANRSGIDLMRYEAKRRGLDNLFDARYVNFTMHTKAYTVDRRMVVAGSVNFHFSSWGPLGLNEAALATSDAQAVAEQQASFEKVWNTQSRPVASENWLKNVQPGSLDTPQPGPERERPERERGGRLHDEQ